MSLSQGLEQAAMPVANLAASPLDRISRAVVASFEAIGVVLLVGLVAFLFGGALSRYAFHQPLAWVDELSRIMFLWLAMLGTVIAAHRAEHLQLTLLLRFIPKRALPHVQALSLAIVLCVILVLLPASIKHTELEWAMISPVLGLRNSFRVGAITGGLGLLAVITALQLIRTAGLRLSLLWVTVCGVAIALMWLLGSDLNDTHPATLVFFFVILFGVCVALSVPIAFCFAVATVSYLAFASHQPLSIVIGRMDEGMSSVLLLSIPIFLLLGYILDETGMGRAIVNSLAALLGHIKAGMSYVLLVSMFFVSGISGSKVSDMAVVAPALFPEMERRGHKRPELVALLSTGATMADTVPPSIVLIVAGSVAGVSIAALFSHGIVIALVLLVALAIVARIRSAITETNVASRRESYATMGKLLLIAAPAMAMPFMIRATLVEGVATATEVSAFAVIYALLIGVVLYGGIKRDRIYGMLVATVSTTGTIMIIMGMAQGMAWALTQSGFAHVLVELLGDLPGGVISFSIITVLVFVVLGCFLEGLPALVLLVPLMFPVARSLGMNEVHYTFIAVVSMNIGLILPPIGIGYYMACSLGKASPDEVMTAMVPYLLALFAGLAVIVAFPQISTGLF